MGVKLPQAWIWVQVLVFGKAVGVGIGVGVCGYVEKKRYAHTVSP